MASGSGTGLVLGPGALLVVTLYLLSMILIGWIGRKKRRGDSLSDFYLAGRSMGLVVLFFTLYATQYSGNTLFGYTGITYRIGFQWTVSVLFMVSIVVAYLLFAPRLFILSREKGFITPGDYILHRFNSPGLRLLTTVLMIYALGNFTLAQLKAMGAAVEGLTDGAVPSAYGILFLAVIMVVYETLGGMRSVAWTDVIQGVVLATGFVVLLLVIPSLGGGLPAVVEKLSEISPEKVQVPSVEGRNTWISFVILLAFGASIYPQAIQRLYAGRSLRTLKRSLALMAFMPFLTTMIALVCGLVGAVVVPGLEGVQSDEILARLSALIVTKSAVGYWLVVVIFAAVLAALMSTADSALLSISSMMTRDIYQPYLRPDSSEEELTRVGKWLSWGVIALLVWLAIGTEKTLVRLLELKFELLIQVSPAFFLGLYWERLSKQSILAGMILGLLVAVGLTLSGMPRVWGFHAGVLGLAVNVLCCAIGSLLFPASPQSRESLSKVPAYESA
jgi:SSS family solute:Na+ symporter/sodium/pantothenate symporter